MAAQRWRLARAWVGMGLIVIALLFTDLVGEGVVGVLTGWAERLVEGQVTRTEHRSSCMAGWCGRLWRVVDRRAFLRRTAWHRRAGRDLALLFGPLHPVRSVTPHCYLQRRRVSHSCVDTMTR